MDRTFTETDMYLPVKHFFTGLGYETYAEVKNCDIALLKDGRLTLIELKKSFTLHLLYQAIERQKPGDEVYVAIPRPARATGKSYKNMLAILKRLGLGLITVAMDSPVKTVEIVVFPAFDFDAKKSPRNQRKKSAIIDELSARTYDLNAGGSAKRKLMTAYREKTIKIACVLQTHGALKASELVNEYGCDKNAYRILSRNLYGWFEKAGDGKFILNGEGCMALTDTAIAPLVAYYRQPL